ncbi:hypothetical protein MASR2M47_06400 [Draconibacterium sp.]
MKSKTQPAIKLSPPSGVIAPNHFIPIIDKTYKLPENKIIPTDNRIADQFNKLEGYEMERTPIDSNPSA